MKYEIKNFKDEGDKKYVGFWVHHEGRKLGIDKLISLSEGKTDEKYVEEAMALCQDEIEEWKAMDDSPKPAAEQESDAHLGKEWDADSKSFK